jgi:hypothetical protein
MEQRVYRGSVTPEELADYLVQRFDPQADLQAQKLGQGSSVMVQIGRGDEPEELRHAITVAIAAATDGQPGVVVTIGQQQWLTPRMATFAAMMGLIGLLVTPWALFALLWPVSELVGSTSLPNDIREAIDLFAGSRGINLTETRELAHPHAR